MVPQKKSVTGTQNKYLIQRIYLQFFCDLDLRKWWVKTANIQLANGPVSRKANKVSNKLEFFG